MPEYWFDHIHLRSAEPIKTAEFYESTFGARKISARSEGDGKDSAKLDLNGVTILINQAREGEPTGLVHFGIRTDRLEAAVAEMKEAGVKFTRDIRQIRPDFKISFLTGPEGEPIELQQGQF
ncbi:MAG: VOC family protein [Dehalococcoidales bacterium]|nr:VOC family protein [Dehalococcoidales bacterium]